MRRELVFKGAAAQLSAFQTLVEAMTWKEYTAAVWDRVLICGQVCEHEGARTTTPMFSSPPMHWSTAR